MIGVTVLFSLNSCSVGFSVILFSNYVLIFICNTCFVGVVLIVLPVVRVPKN